MTWNRALLAVACCVVTGFGCTPERVPTAPVETPGAQLPYQPAFVYTNPQANIHDGTGNGSMNQVPNDPTPGAPGIWLGNIYSARACYANHNAFVVDTDKDWLDDQCEFQLAKAFAPVLDMSLADGCPNGEPYWGAKYFDAPNVMGEPETVRIIYMPGYYGDCGGMGHDGDSEVIMLAVWEDPQTRHWQIRKGFLSAHYGGPNDASDWMDTDFYYPVRSLAYPTVYVALAKHGNYRSVYECQHRQPIFDDDCMFDQPMGRILVLPNRNVGSRFVNNFPYGVRSLYRQNSLRSEFFYHTGGSVRFTGWASSPDGSSTPFEDFLNSNIFENYGLYPPALYSGPGPNPPTQTIMSGVIEGPTQATAFQNTSWTSFVTGGTLPYTSTWSRLEWVAGATWQTAGTTSGTNTTAGTLNYTHLNCNGFTLHATIHSADGQQWTTNDKLVTVVCPQSLAISGPGAISVKGTYTYTATPVGMPNASFMWSERSCTSSGSCGSWSTPASGTNTYSRTLTPDCSGAMLARFELNVTATSGGNSQAGNITTNLCNQQ